MGFADTYFNRFQAEQNEILQPVSDDLELAVVIPAYNEPDIEDTLIGLFHNDDPGCKVDVFLIFNAPEDKDEQIINRNLTDYQHYCSVAESLKHDFIQLHVYWQLFPKKIAGPGSARKYGMDKAIQRFNAIDNPNGIIISLDADAVVSRNYLKSIRQHFINHPEQDGATIYFEHQYQSEDDPVVLYELYLRYFRHAMEWSGYPHHFYAIGSCFAVKAKAYAEQGGMNRKNAGEDFYFLNKIELNGILGECNTPIVYPSGRVSDRVPFGTGPEVKKIREEGGYEVYSLKSFKILSDLVKLLNQTYEMTEETFITEMHNFPLCVQNYQSRIYLWDAILDARENSKDEKSFLKRLYRYFDTFKVIRFLNYLAENKLPKREVALVAAKLADELKLNYEDLSEESLLAAFRQYDKTK